MLEQAINATGKAFKARVDGLAVFLETCVDGPLLVLKASVDIGAKFLETCVDGPLLVLKASVGIGTRFLESCVDGLPKFLKTSICVLTILFESFVKQPLGAVKSGLDSPKGSVFSVLSLLEERVDVGCELHELLVDIGPERIDIRA